MKKYFPMQRAICAGIKKGRAGVCRRCVRISGEQICKPGSVLTVIYLPVPLPARSSHPGSGRANLYAPIPVLLRIEFTASHCLQPTGELLPHLSTLTTAQRAVAVSLCCTCPEVAFGGRYPLSLPCGARTFLTDRLSPCPRDCLIYSRYVLYPSRAGKSTLFLWGKSFVIPLNLWGGSCIIWKEIL